MDNVGIKNKLETYRLQKRRENFIETIKSTMPSMLFLNQNKGIKPTSVKKLNGIKQSLDTDSTVTDADVELSQSSILIKVTYLLYFVLWIILYIIAIEYEFGAIYFICSALILICLNTRTNAKKSNELSAYSIFNPNCKAIEGTIDSTQFDREIRYGM